MTALIQSTAWPRTINGRPAVGVVAERRRHTRMRDVELFSEMTGTATRCTTMPSSRPPRPSGS